LFGEEVYYIQQGWDAGRRPRKWRWQTTVIVNLNQYRKKRRRAEADRRAADNRVRFGRSKEQRSRDLREGERSKKEIDGKRLD
jgi:hypothetical protein